MDIAVKKIGYFLFDYTDKIKTIDEFKAFNNDKCHNNKYDKCIFFINLDKVSKKVKCLLKLMFKQDKHKLDEDNVVIYFNKKSIMMLFTYNNVNYDLFLQTLTQERKEKPECNICFESFNGVITCSKCYYQMCEKCMNDYYYTPNNTRTDAIQCPVCNSVLTFLE